MRMGSCWRLEDRTLTNEFWRKQVTISEGLSTMPYGDTGKQPHHLPIRSSQNIEYHAAAHEMNTAWTQPYASEIFITSLLFNWHRKATIFPIFLPASSMNRGNCHVVYMNEGTWKKAIDTEIVGRYSRKSKADISLDTDAEIVQSRTCSSPHGWSPLVHLTWHFSHDYLARWFFMPINLSLRQTDGHSRHNSDGVGKKLWS